jgi:hypothetical protein
MFQHFCRLKNYGIASGKVLSFLLGNGEEGGGNSQSEDVIVKLMMKFGLLVALPFASAGCGGESDEEGGGREYLVPALLPFSGTSSAVCADTSWSTCYFVFTTKKHNAAIGREDLSDFGFLPSGLFERLIGKVVTWAQATTPSLSVSDMSLRRDEANLCVGSGSFQMRIHPEMSAIEVNFEGNVGYVRTVHARLWDMVISIIKECMKSLNCTTALPYPYAPCGRHFSFDEPDNMLIPLDKIRGVVKDHSYLHGVGGSRLLTWDATEDMYRDWLFCPTDRDTYDVFLSYRWGPDDDPHDDRFVQSIFDGLGISTMDNGREIHVFLDKECLQDGTTLQAEFSKKLQNSLIVVPVVTTEALSRMCDESRRHEEDSVIIEVTNTPSCKCCMRNSYSHL